MANRKRKISTVIRDINKIYKSIAVQRDKLRILISEAEDIVESLDQATVSIDEVVMVLEQLDNDVDDISKFL